MDNEKIEETENQKEQKTDEQEINYVGVGIAFGVVFGIAIFDNVGVGISLGVALGAAFGSIKQNKQYINEKKD